MGVTTRNDSAPVATVSAGHPLVPYEQEQSCQPGRVVRVLRAAT
jgi:hypothetical protein